MQIESVRVHVTGSDIPVGAPAAPEPAGRRTAYFTVTLTAAATPEPLLPPSDKRISAMVQALDDDVVIGNIPGDVARGNGTTIPHGNTAPWPVDDHQAVHVAAAAISGSTSRISVTAIYRT